MIGTHNAEDFSAVLVVDDIATMKIGVAETIVRLRADGQVLAANEIGAAYEELMAQLTLISFEVAQIAEQAILEEEQTSRVRPDTGPDRRSAGPRLEDFLGESIPMTELPGTVLVNNEALMEQSGVGWWWTNEEGYSGFVGRRLQGYFFDAGWSGQTRPNPEDGAAREHPLFGGRMNEPGGKGAIIKHAIPERRFVKRGYEVAQVEWHRRVQRAKARFSQRLSRASVLARQVP